MMKSRVVLAVLGVIACLVGLLWIAQGTNAMHGSAMSGHKQFSALGAVVVVVGIVLLVWAWRIRKAQR
jgi:protein-S-isoprenylcysteine O-methyltransferase Ste14